ncbi:MAG: glycosyltransferase [Candidatus Pacebacteria bacterium]|nr:glycosyltransferase [Candidatus Paceibacterota bacterium]
MLIFNNRMFTKYNLKILLKGIKYLFSHNLSSFLKKTSAVIERELRIAQYNKQYTAYLKQNSLTDEFIADEKRLISRLKVKPKISLVMPTYNSSIKFLKMNIDSVINQIYPNWELCIADDNSSDARVKETIEYYCKKDKRIKCVFRESNGHISKASNSCLEIATGQYVGLLDHDDLLYPNTLSECIKIINEQQTVDFIYTDEDKIDAHGKRFEPHFKPDWSPETLLSGNYITHFSLIKKNLINKVGGFRVGYEGAQDLDLFLRVTELSKQIYHIPKVLYSWRTLKSSTASSDSDAKSDYAYKNGIKSIESALKRREIRATVTEGAGRGLYDFTIHNNFEYAKFISRSTGERLGIQVYDFIKNNSSQYIIFLDKNCSISDENIQRSLGLFMFPGIKMLTIKIVNQKGTIYKTGIIISKNDKLIHAFQGMTEGGYFNFNYSRMYKNFSATSLLGTIIDREFFSKIDLKPIKEFDNYTDIGLYLSYLISKNKQRIVLGYNPLIIYKGDYQNDKLSSQSIKMAQKIIEKKEYDLNYNPNLSTSRVDFSING